eukprot:gene3180-3221_t
MIRSIRLFKLSSSVTLLALALSCNAVSAQNAKPAPAVVIEADGVSITMLDLEAELSKAPPDVRSGFMQQPERLAQLASNLLMRRALAKQAEVAGLAQIPFNQAALQLGKDRVLSDIQLAQLDQSNRPSDMVLEQRARDVYRAETKRFEIPEEVKASHILVLATEENAEAKAAELLADLKGGKDFAELAKASSQDLGSGSKGGDLGFFVRGRMAKQFEEVAFQLKVGELSGLVKTQFGYHIIKVTDRKEAGKQPFEEVRSALLQEVTQKILTEGRIKAGQQIMQRAKAHPEVLEAYVANQQPGK